MSTSMMKPTGLAIIVVVLCWVSVSLAFVSANQVPAEAQGMLTKGEIAPEALKVKTWTNKDPGESFAAGERIILSLQSEEQAYLTVMSVASDGSVTIVFPNKETENNMVQPRKVYTLFGDDSALRLTAGKESKEAKLVFFVTSKPVSLSPLKIKNNDAGLVIPAASHDETQILKQKIEAIVKDEGFNRMVLTFSDASGHHLEVKLSEDPRHGTKPSKKALPAKVESSTPEVVTGTAGLKPLREQGQQQ